MATLSPDSLLDEADVPAHIRRLNLASAKIEAETRKLMAESNKLAAERLKMEGEAKVITWVTIFQAMLATAALLGAGAAIAKLFFP